ncbi:hypothetical protein DFP94_102188 [Fontibacillus phaseoli]|uniref:Uncharacterized protein n=1 Tax=Fontibacillus phaseoli TaxID=1416533 RepID=A0A369BJY0_9BACL|nr:hypothetical protein [Fontibacillus phaseoli]RCX21435.1 hypothetical protein DFP94_102188 [Fontibacillus phaseoli]
MKKRGFNYVIIFLFVISLLGNVFLYTKLQDEKSNSSVSKTSDESPITKRLAFIKQLISEEGQYYLVLDYAEWFSDAEAEKAAKEDGDPEAGSLSNGFYIRNETNEQEKVKLEKDGLFYVMDGATPRAVDYNEFVSSELEERLFNLRFAGDTLVAMEEQYRP